MPLYITIPTDHGDITLTFEQMVVINRITQESEGHAHWHPNDCGCCFTVHTPDSACVVNPDGDETWFPNRGCQCPAD